MTLQEKNEEISALHFDSSEGRGSSVQNGNNGIGNGIVNGNGNGNGTTREVPEDALHRDFFESIPLFATLFGITFSYLAVFAAPLLVSVGLPVLEQTFGTTPDSVFIPASNTIGQCVALFVVGRLSDSFGRRWFVVFGNILSMIGYMVAARAYNTSVNIGGSFLFGLGAGVQLLTIMFALELVPFNRRYLTYAYILSAWGPILAIAAGIVFTFVATAEDSWRWIAYFAFITSFVSLVFTLVLYHPQPISDTHPAAKREVATKTDWIGTVVWTGSTVSFLLGIYLGGQRYPWRSARTIVPIVVGGVGWIVALVWEFLTRSHYTSQVLPLLAKRNYVTLTLTISFVSMAWQAPSMLWNQQIVTIFGGDALLAGWYYNIIFAGPALGQIIAGVMATGFPILQSQLVIAALLVLAFGPALAAYTSTQLSLSLVFGLVAGAGVGITDVLCIVGTVSTAGVNLKEYGVAAGVVWTARRIATAIAYAIYTTILNSKVQKNLLSQVVPVLIKGGLTPQAAQSFLQLLLAGDSASLSTVPGVTPTLVQTASVAARGAFADSFKVVYLTSIAFGACGVITAALAHNGRLDKTRTRLVARKLGSRPQGVGWGKWLIPVGKGREQT